MLRAIVPHPTHDLAGISRYASRGGENQAGERCDADDRGRVPLRCCALPL